MSRNGHIDLHFAGEPRRFRLGIAELEELQEITDVGPFVMLARVMATEGYSFSDVAKIIRVGLTGGGLPLGDAYALVADLGDMPLPVLVEAAGQIMAAALEQPAGEPSRRRAKSDDAEEEPDGHIQFASYYEAAGALGLAVSDVRAMSLWQFVTYLDGHRKAHDPKAQNELTDAEEDALAEMIGLSAH